MLSRVCLNYRKNDKLKKVISKISSRNHIAPKKRKMKKD